MVHTFQNLEDFKFNSDLEIHQHLGSLKHVINIIIWISHSVLQLWCWVSRGSELRQGGAWVNRWEEGMPGRSFIGLEGEWGGQTMEGNGRRWWCTMMVVVVAVSGGDQLGRW
jgi:hypothetical protein